MQVQPDKNDLISIVYDTPIFYKVALNYIKSIDILITSSLGDVPVDFEDDEVIVGLTFRQSI